MLGMGMQKNKKKVRAVRKQARLGWVYGLWRKPGTEDGGVGLKSWAQWVCS